MIDLYYWPTPNGWKVIMDARLAANPCLAGYDYSIADIITWPWAMLLFNQTNESVRAARMQAAAGK